MSPHSITAAEYRAMQDRERPRGVKFGNVPTTVDGIKFDSQAEARFYAVLKLREKAGEVSNIRVQEPFSLKGENGQVVGIYKSDFCFDDHVAGRYRVVDVKGGKATQTAVFKLKAKLMQATHGITVEVEG